MLAPTFCCGSRVFEYPLAAPQNIGASRPGPGGVKPLERSRSCVIEQYPFGFEKVARTACARMAMVKVAGARSRAKAADSECTTAREARGHRARTKGEVSARVARSVAASPQPGRRSKCAKAAAPGASRLRQGFGGSAVALAKAEASDARCRYLNPSADTN
jgi:hypothetical protein